MLWRQVLSLMNNARLAAYAGSTPSQRFSGSSVKGKPRLSKIGTRRLRKTMFSRSCCKKAQSCY